MTKLFYQDTHMTDFTAIVLQCLPGENGHFRILLDQTAFFPEEGGQAADTGTLDGQPVLDVQISDGSIWHYIKNPIPQGHCIEGHVDWDRRFDFMQQHSGEHIISGLVHEAFGYDNTGFHLGLTEVTLDFNGKLTLTELRSIEEKANQVVWQNLPVRTFFPSPQELSSLTYRSKLELTEDVRIVEIPGVDTCACCAPHVDTTGQIGLIKIISVMSHRGGVRVNILCGRRAIMDYTQKQDSVAAVSVLLSARPDRISQAVTQLQGEALRLKERANALQADLLTQQLSLLPSPSASPHAFLFTGELDAKAVRNTVNLLCERYEGYCGIFSGTDTEGYRFIIGSSTRDCRELAGRLREALGAKGGGSAPMIQGSVCASKEALSSFLAAL